MLLIEKKIPKNGHIVYFGINDYQAFDNFYEAYNFAVRLSDFVKYFEIVDGTEKSIVDDKEKFETLFSVKIQLDEQEDFAKSNKEVLDVISQLRAL